MNKRFNLLLVLMLVVSIMITACGGGTAKEKPTKAGTDQEKTAASEKGATEASKADKKASGDLDKIAFICADMANESQAFSSREFEKYGKDYGFDVTVLDSKGNAQDESTLVTNCIAQGMKAIFLNPNDVQAIIPSVKEAHEAGLIVGLFSSDLPDEGKPYRDLFVGVDDTLAGEQAAQAFKDKFPNGAKVVEIGGQSGHDAAIKRHDGFSKAIEGSNIEVLAFQSPDAWDTAQAMAIMEDMITSYGDQIQGVFCHWDIGCTGVIQALTAAGMIDNVFVVGVDGNKAGYAQVEAGTQNVTISQNFTKQVLDSLQNTRDLLDGKKIEEYTFTPLDVITTDNVKDFPVPEW